LLAREAIAFRVAQYRDREKSRRSHQPIWLLELAGKARGCDDIAVRLTPERTLSQCVVSTVLHGLGAIASAAWRTWIEAV
jgi:hypothetical protein